MNKFNEVYEDLLLKLYYKGLHEENVRTGVGITMLRGGGAFKLDLSDQRLPMAGNRRYWPHIAAAEVAWQFSGTQDAKWILAKAPKLWGNFVEDGKIETAYGYRWREHFDRDQIAMAVNALRDDPTNRQVYVSAWDPSGDGLGVPNQPKNIPCPVGFSLTRTEDELHCSVFVRSSDVFVGLPYDVMGYALTLDAIAASLDVRPGTLHFTLAHAHYYDPHIKAVGQCLKGDHTDWMLSRPEEIPLPAWSVEQIGTDPDGYVEHVRRLSRRIDHNDWNPMPELVV